MERYLVFVYGTLRKGEKHHELLQDSTLLASQAWIEGTLYDTEEGYPAVKEEGSKKVYGELYKISAEKLLALDIIEGYSLDDKNNLYIRKKRAINTDNQSVEAYVYIIAYNNYHMLKREIPSGDWKLEQWIKRKPERFMYFAYGSCMDEERFIQDGVSEMFSEVVASSLLFNYYLCFSRHSTDGGRADIKEGEGLVEGVIYLLPFPAIEYLFKREGVNSEVYRPIFVNVELNKVMVEVLSFTVINKKEDLAPPDHYAIEILRGAKKHLSSSYNEFLKEYFLSLGLNICQLESTLMKKQHDDIKRSF